MLTKQIWLNRSRDGSLGGKFPSMSATGSCCYRGPDRTACAVGINIPEEPMPKNTEGQYTDNNCPVFTLIARNPLLRPYIIPVDTGEYDDINSVQVAHDSCAHAIDTVSRESTKKVATPRDHEKFMKKLLELDYFKGMQPSA